MSDFNSDEEMIAFAKEAVFKVKSIADFGENRGTGFVLEHNLLVTNHHVIQYGTKIELVAHDDEIVKIRGIKYFNEEWDIVVFEIDRYPNSLVLAQNSPDVGSKCFLIGHFIGNLAWSVTKGIVSAIRQPKATLTDDGDGGTWIQIDARNCPGGSGGPILNKSGEVIGLASRGDSHGNEFGLAVSDIIRSVDFAKASKRKKLKNALPLKDPEALAEPEEFEDDEREAEDDDIRRAVQIFLNRLTRGLFPLTQGSFNFLKTFVNLFDNSHDTLMFENVWNHLGTLASVDIEPESVWFSECPGEFLGIGDLGPVFEVKNHNCLIIDKSPGTSLTKHNFHGDETWNKTFMVGKPLHYETLETHKIHCGELVVLPCFSPTTCVESYADLLEQFAADTIEAISEHGEDRFD